MASAASAKTKTEQDTQDSPALSVPELCLKAALKHAKEDALNHKIGDEWINISAEEFVERVRHVALGLAELGNKAWRSRRTAVREQTGMVDRRSCDSQPRRYQRSYLYNSSGRPNPIHPQ